MLGDNCIPRYFRTPAQSHVPDSGINRTIKARSQEQHWSAVYGDGAQCSSHGVNHRVDNYLHGPMITGYITLHAICYYSVIID